MSHRRSGRVSPPSGHVRITLPPGHETAGHQAGSAVRATVTGWCGSGRADSLPERNRAGAGLAAAPHSGSPPVPSAVRAAAVPQTVTQQPREISCVARRLWSRRAGYIAHSHVARGQNSQCPESGTGSGTRKSLLVHRCVARVERLKWMAENHRWWCGHV